MDEHPELANTHKFYDMTRAEQQTHWLKKTNFAYRHYSQEWFKAYKTGEFNWIYLQLGQGVTSMHYLMF